MTRLFLCGLLLGSSACTTVLVNEDGHEGGAGGSGEGGNGEGATSGGAGGCAAPASASFAIGTGEDCFEAITEGSVVPLISGPQGGYHVWLAVGCTDCGASPVISWGVRDPATGQPLEGTYDNEGVIDVSGAWPQSAGIITGMPGISWDPENEPPPAPGTPFVLWVRADESGHEAEVQLIVGETVQWDPCAENPEDPACGFG